MSAQQDQSGLTPEQLAATRTLDVPSFSPSDFALMGVGEEIIAVLQSVFPLVMPDGTLVPKVARIMPMATIHLTPASAKNFWLVLGEHIRNHEKLYGTISTSYSNSLGMDASKPK